MADLGPMLNLYPDSVGGNLAAAADFLELPALRGAFSSVYVLPSLFHSDLDRGFCVVDYGLEETLATDGDLARLRTLGLKPRLCPVAAVSGSAEKRRKKRIPGLLHRLEQILGRVR